MRPMSSWRIVAAVLALGVVVSVTRADDFLAVGHIGGDDAYGKSDQSIVMDSFNFKSADPPAGLKASTTSPVHPVLIRNEHGPLLRIVVEAADAKDARVTALSFQF